MIAAYLFLLILLPQSATPSFSKVHVTLPPGSIQVGPERVYRQNCFPGFCATTAAISLLAFSRLSFRFDCCCILVLGGVLGWDGSLTSVYDGLPLENLYKLNLYNISYQNLYIRP